METQTLIRLVVGLLMTAVVLVFAAKRVLWLTKLIRSGQPTRDEGGRKDNISHAHHHAVQRSVRADSAAPVVDPRHRPLLHHVGLLHPGSASTSRPTACCSSPKFPIPFVGHWDALGFLQDFFALAVLLGIATFAIIRLRSRAQGVRPRLAVLRLAHRRRLADPVHDLQRHLDLRAVPRSRGAQPTNLPYGWGAFFSHGMGALLAPLGHRQRVHRDRRAACCTSASCWSSC